MCFKVNVNWQSIQRCSMHQFSFFHIQIWLVSQKDKVTGVAHKLALMEFKLNPNFSYCSVK